MVYGYRLDYPLIIFYCLFTVKCSMELIIVLFISVNMIVIIKSKSKFTLPGKLATYIHIMPVNIDFKLIVLKFNIIRIIKLQINFQLT